MASRRIGTHLALIACIGVIGFPLYYAFIISTQSMEQAIARPPVLIPSTKMIQNYRDAWVGANMGRLLFNTAIIAVTVAVGKIAMSVLSAFAIVFFRFRFRAVVFWLIFITLMLPVPIRIVSTYQIVSSLRWIDTYMGLTIPLMASATATFLFRQYMQTVPRELAEAAQLDGAGPLRFLVNILLPISLPNIAALFVVLFVYGWNQYLWPLMVTNSESMRTVVIGIEELIPRSGTHLPEWNVMMAAAVMALLPPVLVIILMQKWFVKGLVDLEK